MMRHLIHFTDGRIQPLWAPGTPFRERFRLARAFRAFAEGLDPRDREGFYRFDVDTDGNAMVGGRARPTVLRWRQPVRISVGDRARVCADAEYPLSAAVSPYAGMDGWIAGFDDGGTSVRVYLRITDGPTIALDPAEVVILR